jgi:formate/nitrite transporter FocA (FNT family)
MKKYLYILLSGFISGILIGIGVIVYLSMLSGGYNNYLAKICGALFFGLGLFAIIVFKTWLYTGKVGNALNNKPNYFIDLLFCLMGNIIGIILFTKLMKLTRYNDILTSQATSLVEAKQNDSWYSILILSIMCGVMIYIAVKGYEVINNSVGKVLIVFLAIATFILSGFEHVVANAGYYSLANYFSWSAFGYFCLMAIGNGIGAISFDGLLRISNKLLNSSTK